MAGDQRAERKSFDGLWEPTMRLRQVVDQTHGFIGVQQLWRSDLGDAKWQWIESTTPQLMRSEGDRTEGG